MIQHVKAREWLERNRGVSRGTRARVLYDYAEGRATAAWRLRSVSERGTGAQTRGAPIIRNRSRLVLGDEVLLISRYLRIQLMVGEGAELRIGDSSRIHYGTTIVAVDSIRIGKGVWIGPHCTIYDSSFHEAHDRSIEAAPAEVVLQDDVWLATRVIVLPGVTMGTASIAGAGAVVSKDVEPYAVVAGNPARVVRRLDPEAFVRQR